MRKTRTDSQSKPALKTKPQKTRKPDKNQPIKQKQPKSQLIVNNNESVTIKKVIRRHQSHQKNIMIVQESDSAQQIKILRKYISNQLIPLGQDVFMSQTQKNQIIIGQTKFSVEQGSLSKHSLHQLNNMLHYRRKQFQVSDWSINSPIWNFLLKYMRQTPCIVIEYFKGLENPAKSLSQPDYTRLRQLKLANSGICSIQALSFMNAPCLKHINLSSNKLRTISSLQKAFLPELYHLILYDNLLNQIQIDRLNMDQHDVINIIFGRNNCQSYDLTFYIKMEGNNFSKDMKKELEFISWKKFQFLSMKRLCGQVLQKCYEFDLETYANVVPQLIVIDD